MNSLVVCVDFDDFLEITLPRNKRHFNRTLVVTTCADAAAQRIAYKNGCECFATESFYEGDAAFNKGLAIEKGLDVLGRDGWLCVWDADIVMPGSIKHDYDRDCLYTPYRRTMIDPSQFSDDLDWEKVTSVGPEKNEFPGYFHLFHTGAAGVKPWYSTNWRHAGGYDSDFQNKFANRLRRPPYMVLHLGPTVDDKIEDLPARVGENWCGRVTPRLDTGLVPAIARVHRKAVETIIKGRRKLGWLGLVDERLNQTIPRRMSFFWVGRMSWLRWLSLKTFIKYNPGWEVRLYSSELPVLPKHWKMDTDDDHLYYGEDYRDRLPLAVNQCSYTPPRAMSAAQSCDWFQWHLLAVEGGFFADMDIVWRRGLDAVWNETKEADAVFCLESGVMAVGLVGSKPGCKLFQDMAISMVDEQNRDYQHYGTNWVYRFSGVKLPVNPAEKPGELALQHLRKHYSKDGRGAELTIADVPDYTVYPFDWNQVDTIWKEKREIDNRSVGLHWFGGNKLSRYWNQLLTEEDWQNHNNTMTSYLAKVLE
jgi:hypothetical protein